MKIMCIHGIGHQEERVASWREDWVKSITDAVGEWDATATVKIQQFAYDDLFDRADSSSFVYFTAMAKLIKSWVTHSGERDIFGLFDKYRWTVGMVAQFVALPELRVALRNKLAADIAAFNPDVIVAHSLGGMIAYDTLSSSHTRDLIGGFNGRLVTIGTQIAHPSVCEVFAGRVQYPFMLARWWNFHNEDDAMFTRSFSLPGETRFKEVRTPFEFQLINHDADQYLTHEQAKSECWRELVLGLGSVGGVRGIAAAKSIKAARTGKKLSASATAQAANEAAMQTAAAANAVAVPVAPPRQKLRALLVGIAEYADPSYALAGPVNDVFLVSQTLQEMGVNADAIRVVLNERATAAAIRERLAWLLADARDGDIMFFYFSGHGAQVPAYGRDAEVDRIDECLVPYDFNWQTGHAIFDDEFAALYSQLPYKSKLVAMFDCCHAGGMQRGGSPIGGGTKGASGARSIAMPDDIRHRALRWDSKAQMWLPRKKLLADGQKLKSDMMKQAAIKPSAVAASTKVEGQVGADGTLRRIGRAQMLRGDTPADYDARREEYGHFGPYMPILLEACAENQSAYEYQHGSVAYGAFTYALCESLNRGRKLDKNAPAITFDKLIDATKTRVKPVASGPQTPQLVCATVHRDQTVFG